jgi:SAM-dependent methyltransferase
MHNGLHEISGCEVCGNASLESVLDLGDHPMCDDLVPVGDSRVCKAYPIEILYCPTCHTAHQRFQVPKRELFPASYHYRARFTADVLNGMRGLVASCGERFGNLAGKVVVDIGCNDGSLLDFFRERGATTIGIEPTGAFADARAKGHATFNDYFGPGVAEAVVAAHGKPDFISFTNVFAHIENLREVVTSLRVLMKPGTVLVVENHYLGSVLDGGQFDTFYHEHPRSYSYTSFVHIARSLGVKLLEVEFPARYGGNIRVFMGNVAQSPRANSVDLDALAARESRFGKDFVTMRVNIERWLQTKKAAIQALVRKHGKLRAKAFPGRAAILVKMLELDADTVGATHEKPGSLKIGHYLPGTRIPIHSDDALFALPDQSLPILNLAWHIPAEIRGYLGSHGYKGEVVDILSASDFRP